MTPNRWRSWAPAVGLLLLTGYQLWGVALVPFHPDESSLLFQSRDFEAIFRSPTSLAWSADRQPDPELSYRLLNAPFPKYVLGFGRWLAGVDGAEVSVDWDWTQDWIANLGAGALPTPRALLAGRIASSSMLPFAALFLYLCGKQLGGPWVGGLAAALLGLNALVLVHGRRAMAEGTLIFAICFALWSLLGPRRRPWLSGLGIGLALGAKHSALALLPVGILAVLWGAGPSQPIRQKLSSVGMFVLVLMAVTLALNPVVWSEPASALREIFHVRMSLVQDQVQAQAIAAQQAIAVPLRGIDRLAVLIGHLFLAPPQFQEIGNYRAELDSSVAHYLAVPGHALLRGRTLGGLSLGLTLAGLFFGLATLRTGSRSVSRTAALLLISTAALALTLYIGIPLPYQRYYVPLVPQVCLWSAFAVIRLGQEMKKLPFIRAALG
ncbi:MAG TPA: hypothetical protein VI520_01240 [Anaerolineales bacterium]|nr:hypothetical protein [Anaerolineales bacterium]